MLDVQACLLFVALLGVRWSFSHAPGWPEGMESHSLSPRLHNRWAIEVSCLSAVTPISWPSSCVGFARVSKGNIGFPEISRQSLLEYCVMECMAALASWTELSRWLILLSWVLHQLLTLFICFLVDCIDLGRNHIDH